MAWFDNPYLFNPRAFQPQSYQEEMFTPERRAYDMLFNNINQMPQRKQPGKWENFGASIVGMGAGLKPLGIVGGQPIGASFDPKMSALASEEFLYRPYNREMQDWQAKNEAILPGAKLESEVNQNNRLLYDAKLDRNLRTRTIERQEARDRQIAEKEEGQLAVAQQNANTREMTGKAYAFKQNNPDYKTLVDDEGNVVFWNPKDPTKVIQSGINTGKMSDMDRINLQIEGNLKAIQARHQASLTEIDARGDKAIEVNDRRPTTSSRGPANPELEKRRALANKANQVKLQNPQWAQWIKVDGDKVSVTPPKSGYFGSGPDQATYTAIATAISGVEKPTGGVDQSQVVKPGSTNNSTPVPAGRVRVRNKETGQTGTVSEAALRAYPNKYERVK
jgi:hypothetical protein